MAAISMLLTRPLAEARDYKADKLAEVEKVISANLSADDRPVVEYGTHTQGRVALVVGNNGTFGTEGRSVVDPLTGEAWQACEYPIGSNQVYLWVAALWVGAVKGRDTLVSCGTEDFYCTYEFWPEIRPFGDIERKSIDPASPFFAEDAYSEEDIVCEYTDTISDPMLTRYSGCSDPPHVPLGIKATQRSMAWSYEYADDFILFDYQVENIGNEKLEEVYMGIWIDGDIWHEENQDAEHWTDDLVGFYQSHPAPEGCGFIDTINIAYHTDNDGDPDENWQWDYRSPRSAIGVRVVRTPSDSLKYSYNWWIIDYGSPDMDFGPRQIGTPEDPFRDFGGRLGTPEGDENKYYILRHDEFDYDLLYTAVDHSDSGRGWLPPPEYAEVYAEGYDVRNLLSFGPFNIDPGEKLPITFAWIGGDNVHVNPRDFQTFDPHYPAAFYDRLDFSALAVNSRWASWIYDNPGVDTDDNDYYGEFRVCCHDTMYTEQGIEYGACDTTWYTGDRVPDFRGASPPPAPTLWVYPSVGSFRIRFNGLYSETAEDRFSGVADFEGYRVYIGRDDRESSFSLLATYDLEDYNKFVFDYSRESYVLLEKPFTREELQELYGDPSGTEEFNPLLYTRDNPFQLSSDSIFYFVPQDFNQSRLGIDTPIRKVYENAPYPSTLFPELADSTELTEDGYLKYFEYEIIIDNLLPTVPYYVSVTAFDFGSPEVGLASLETSVLNSAVIAYPLASTDEVEENDLKVYVYPNPYRSDAHYDQLGFENPDGLESENRMRRIHFANLPKVCKIYIYSLDGDLVRELDHNYPEGGPEAMHDTWNLITRNTQAAVSGLYYWVVESEDGVQMGKFAIIK